MKLLFKWRPCKIVVVVDDAMLYVIRAMAFVFFLYFFFCLFVFFVVLLFVVDGKMRIG